MKTDRVAYPFAQCPRYADEVVDMTQSNAIMRYLGRMHNLAGADLKQQAVVDMLVDGVESLKAKYLALIYQDQLSDEAKAAYWAAHCDPATTAERNGGAHFMYLSDLIARSSSGTFAVGASWTIADVMVSDIVSMHLRIFPEFAEAYPTLAGLHAAFEALPGVAAYVASDRRPMQQNGNPLG